MEHLTIQVGTFEVNCTLMVREGKALIVDPGQEASRLLELLDKRSLEPEAILLTHAHFDHIGAVPALLARFPGLRVCLADADRQVVSHPMNALPPEYPPIAIPAAALQSPDAFAAGWGYVVLPTPGHTPGGVSYHFPSEELVLTGDTLFSGSVGRTDLPGGDMATLMRSLQALKALPPETAVIPGHGPFTTIGRECAGNPFLQ